MSCATFKMNSYVHRIMAREYGLRRSVGFNVKEKLTQLVWKEDDRITVAENNPIYSMEFCPASTQPKIVAVSDETGGVTLIDTQTNSNSKIVSQHQCHRASLYSVTWSIPQPNFLATGGSDQIVNVWDANDFRLVCTFKGHVRTVRKVKFHHTRPTVLASGGRDGAIILWDTRQTPKQGPVNVILNAHSMAGADGGSPKSVDRKSRRQKKCITPTPVTDFLFIDDNNVISCGATDSQIKFWDIRKTYMHLHRVQPVRYLDYEAGNSKGYSAICVDDNGNLYASTARDNIVRYKFQEESSVPDAIYRRPSSDYSVTIALSPDGRYLTSGSVTPFAFIWDTWDESTQLPFVHLEGTLNDYFATPCAVFSPNDPLKVVTGADDSKVTIWRFVADGNLGSVLYKSSTPSDLPLARFNSVSKPDRRFIPIMKKTEAVQTGKANLDDLPNFVMDGRLPHVPQVNGRKPPARVHTWLSNFHQLKSPARVKKTIRLKRKAPASSSSTAHRNR